VETILTLAIKITAIAIHTLYFATHSNGADGAAGATAETGEETGGAGGVLIRLLIPE
jgi:hypothetical protein